MVLGASWRRLSSLSTRVTGLVSTTVLLWAAAGTFGAEAATAPYPPTPPCALSWTQPAAEHSGQPMLVGSGYDTDQPVTVTLYPQAASLGSYATNSAGAFQAAIAIPDSESSWVTASSPHRSCSVVPPGSGGSAPGGGSTSPATAGPSTPVGTGSAPAGGASPSPTVPGAPGNGSGNGAGGSGAGSSASPYPPNGSATSSSGATSSGTSTPGAPTSSRPESTPNSTPNNADTRTASTLGLPLSVIVTIAALLLLGGGLAVLFLTRRSS